MTSWQRQRLRVGRVSSCARHWRFEEEEAALAKKTAALAAHSGLLLWDSAKRASGRRRGEPGDGRLGLLFVSLAPHHQRILAAMPSVRDVLIQAYYHLK